MQEVAPIETATASRYRPSHNPDTPQPLNEIDTQSYTVIKTTIGEFDRVLSGGIVRGMTILIGGEPGIGKSTLLMQLAAVLGESALYVSSEESATQLKMRAERLSCAQEKFNVLCTANLERIVEVIINTKPAHVVIDSIQMIRSINSESAVGSNTQLRMCCQELIDCARGLGITLLLVAHVTKEGHIAGPKLIEHLVDTVLYFEEHHDQTRFLRATKNRLGGLNEIGIFEMQQRGLVGIDDPSHLFLTDAHTARPAGVATAGVFEGTRAFIVEVQALTVQAGGSISRVYSDRIDPRRISRIAAVLERHAGIMLHDQDIYINIAGGIHIQDVGIELAIAHALFSAKENIPLPREAISIGELSLSGEIKAVKHLMRRIKGAKGLGYTYCIGPERINRREQSEVEWIRCATVGGAIEQIRRLMV